MDGEVTVIAPLKTSAHPLHTDEEWAALKRAAALMGVPQRVVGAQGGCFWVEDANHPNRGKLWDAWDPIHRFDQAMEIIARNQFSVIWLEATLSQPKPQVVVHDTYYEFDPTVHDAARKAIARAAVIAAAVKFEMNRNKGLTA